MNLPGQSKKMPRGNAPIPTAFSFVAARIARKCKTVEINFPPIELYTRLTSGATMSPILVFADPPYRRRVNFLPASWVTPGEQMARLQTRASAYVAAFGLAILTLTIFGLSMDRGPAAVVRELHEYSAGPSETVPDLFTPDTDPAIASNIYGEVRAFLHSGASSKVIYSGSQGSRAIVDVWYESEQSAASAYRFVLMKGSGDWKIDGNATWSLTRKLRTPGSG
jgi:hypothetical protein